MFAQSIHNDSQRRRMPFVAVNCAAIPEQLLESELFGYAPGAFTGAHRDGKAGLFELAHKGTLFWTRSERFHCRCRRNYCGSFQEREIMRVGGDSVIPVDIRILAATNQNLEQLAAERQFREDLLYRLDVLRINIPSLNQRREDISLLADSYMRRAFPDIRITDEAKAYFRADGLAR
ncbi:MAG: sigma 54-interacting transcriptional regulator [Enterocloster sp.]